MMRRFKGTLRVTPVHLPAFEVEAEWEYDPDTGCYYGGGESFPAEICDVVGKEETDEPL